MSLLSFMSAFVCGYMFLLQTMGVGVDARAYCFNTTPLREYSFHGVPVVVLNETNCSVLTTNGEKVKAYNQNGVIFIVEDGMSESEKRFALYHEYCHIIANSVSEFDANMCAYKMIYGVLV